MSHIIKPGISCFCISPTLFGEFISTFAPHFATDVIGSVAASGVVGATERKFNLPPLLRAEHEREKSANNAIPGKRW